MKQGGGGGGWGGYKQTQSHSHPCTRVHIAAHRTLAQSAMDKKIIPLSFLECSLPHPPSPVPYPPIPPLHTLRKHRLLSPSCDSPGAPTSRSPALHKHSPVLYHTRKSVFRGRRSGPVSGVPTQPGVIWTPVSSSLNEQLGHPWTNVPFICSNPPGSVLSPVPRTYLSVEPRRFILSCLQKGGPVNSFIQRTPRSYRGVFGKVFFTAELGCFLSLT